MSELEAGRELDALVAEKIFGFTRIGYYGPNKAHGMHQDYDFFGWDAAAAEAAYVKYWGEDEDRHPVSLCHWRDDWGPLVVGEYSTYIGEAWEVVEKMREYPVGVRTLTLRAYSYSRTYAAFCDVNLLEDDERWSEANGEHATPLAICRAALKALSSHPSRKAVV